MPSDSLTLDVLTAAVAGDGAAIRSVTRLQPAGGAGDKVFPPTYATGDRTLRYAVETRRVGGQEVPTVLLDSVASQANRLEEALLARWESREMDFPVIAIDFSDTGQLGDLGRITTLQAPHRIADALLRDSVDRAGKPFRETEAGQAFTAATPGNATAVFKYCPTALVFGVWDSTGPKGGLGSKFPRSLVSEIVAVNAVPGCRVGSRIDPVGIQANVDVYHRADDRDDWTIRVEEALREKNKPVPFSRRGAEGKGKPSAINHSNVAPTVDELAGGITFDHAVQTTVLSLPALRRLRFPTDVSGKRLDDARRRDGEAAARTALAALALAGMSSLRARGHDLRSRCLLVPDPGGPMTLEILPADGGQASRFTLGTTEAAHLLGAAASRAAGLGFGWEREPVTLRPAPKLADLIRRSRELAAAGEGGEDDAEA
jgi:CRISPR-associated protein Csb1